MSLYEGDGSSMPMDQPEYLGQYSPLFGQGVACLLSLQLVTKKPSLWSVCGINAHKRDTDNADELDASSYVEVLCVFTVSL